MGILDNLISGKRIPMGMGLDSVIGEHAKFKGELITSGSVNINGEFDGRIRAEGEVIVASKGKVVGEIRAGSVSISGKVDGNITTSGVLEITREGQVQGDITGGKIVIDEGSSYRGKVRVEPAVLTEEQVEVKEELPSSEISQATIFPEV
jgi:cytoskeletal protein CcmA (bactofilin family)